AFPLRYRDSHARVYSSTFSMSALVEDALGEGDSRPAWVLRGRLDLTRIGFIGHSQGGIVALLFPAEDERIREDPGCGNWRNARPRAAKKTASGWIEAGSPPQPPRE